MQAVGDVHVGRPTDSSAARSRTARSGSAKAVRQSSLVSRGAGPALRGPWPGLTVRRRTGRRAPVLVTDVAGQGGGPAPLRDTFRGGFHGRLHGVHRPMAAPGPQARAERSPVADVSDQRGENTAPLWLKTTDTRTPRSAASLGTRHDGEGKRGQSTTDRGGGQRRRRWWPWAAFIVGWWRWPWPHGSTSTTTPSNRGSPVGAEIHHRPPFPIASGRRSGPAHRRRGRTVTALSYLIYHLQSDTTIYPENEITGGARRRSWSPRGTSRCPEAEAAAKTAALRRLGYPVTATASGAVIFATFPRTPAYPVLHVGDAVTAVDGGATPMGESLIHKSRSTTRARR